MRLNRDITLFFHFLLDQCLPPVLRDSDLFMYPFFKFLFGKKSHYFMNFKEQAFSLSPKSFKEYNQRVSPKLIQRKTDLNHACLREIEKNILGASVLDIACGRAFLAQRLSQSHQVTAADIIVDPALASSYYSIQFAEAYIDKLPFADKTFDTVVSTHTLEHVPNIHQAIAELRRVSLKRLIVVVPKQRPYQYTFDLHLHFFPYSWVIWSVFGQNGQRQECKLIKNDWLYIEDLN